MSYNDFGVPGSEVSAYWIEYIDNVNKRCARRQARLDAERRDELIGDFYHLMDVSFFKALGQVYQVAEERRLEALRQAKEAEDKAREAEKKRQAQERLRLRNRLMVAFSHGLVIAQKAEEIRKAKELEVRKLREQQEKDYRIMMEQQELAEKKLRSSRKYLRGLESNLYLRLWNSLLYGTYYKDKEHWLSQAEERGLSKRKIRQVASNVDDMVYELNPVLFSGANFGSPPLRAVKLKNPSYLLDNAPLKLNPLSLFQCRQAEQEVLKIVLSLISPSVNKSKKLLIMADKVHQPLIIECLKFSGIPLKMVDFGDYSDLTTFGLRVRGASQKMTVIKTRLVYSLGIEDRNKYLACLIFKTPSWVHWKRGTSGSEFLEGLGKVPPLVEAPLILIDSNFEKITSQEVFKVYRCHPQSLYGKKDKNNLILTSLGSSSIYNPQTFLCSVDDQRAKVKESLAIYDPTHLEYLRSRASGHKALTLIKEGLRKHGWADSSEIKSWFPSFIGVATIQAALRTGLEDKTLEKQGKLYSIPQRKKLYAV